jgi:hypothetical protein
VVPLRAAAVVVVPLHAEAAAAELTRRAAAAVVAPLHAEGAVVVPLRAAAVVPAPLHAGAEAAELTRRAEAAVVAPLRAEAVAVLHAEAVAVLLHAEAAELTRRAEAACAPRGQVTVRREACDCREASRCYLRPWCPAAAHREAHDCPEWSGHCQGRVSHLVLTARCRSLRRRRQRHDGLAARWRRPAYPDARRQRRHRSIAPGVWSPQRRDDPDCC